MATYQIVRVHKESVHRPYTHGHIEEVETSDGSRFSRQQVIDRIDQGDAFYTYADAELAWVFARLCPACLTPNQITTTADHTTANNLDNLPTY